MFATLRYGLDTLFDAFLQRFELFILLLKSGERLRRFDLEALRTWADVLAKNLGFSILVPSDNAAAEFESLSPSIPDNR